MYSIFHCAVLPVLCVENTELDLPEPWLKLNLRWLLNFRVSILALCYFGHMISMTYLTL